MKIEFQSAGKIGMAGAGSRQDAARLINAGKIFDGKRFLPVGPVAVFDAQRDGSADGLPVADSGKRLDAILLNLLTAAAAVSKLPAVQFVLHKIEINVKAGNVCLDFKIALLDALGPAQYAVPDPIFDEGCASPNDGDQRSQSS